jgi:hypothetical protein
MKSTIIVYDSKSKMEAGTKQMISAGWNVEYVTVLPGSYRFVKTCLLGILFLPLALLGKDRDQYSVKFTTNNDSASRPVAPTPIVKDYSDKRGKSIMFVLMVIAIYVVLFLFFSSLG